MEHVLEITRKGKKLNKVYLAGILVFWLVWTICTVQLMRLNSQGFGLFWILFFPVGIAGIILIPFDIIVHSKRPIVLTISESNLRIKGYRFRKNKDILVPIESPIRLHQGYVREQGENECAPGANILFKKNGFWKRYAISGYLHPDEQIVIIEQIEEFFRENGLNVSTSSGVFDTSLSD